MKKRIFISCLLLSITAQVSAAPKQITAPFKHVSFGYDDAMWEGRSFSTDYPNYAIRAIDSHIVFAVSERTLLPDYQTADAILAKIESEFKAQFDVAVIPTPTGLQLPDSWTCHSYAMTAKADQSTGQSIACIAVGKGYFERIDVIAHVKLDTHAVQMLNSVMSSVTRTDS